MTKQASKSQSALTHGGHVLVTGASSGVGLALAAQLLARDTVQSLTTVSRRASASEPLQAMRQQHGKRLRIIDADITNEAALTHLAETLTRSDVTLHVVVNAAGLLHNARVQPEKSLAQVDRASLEEVFAINAFAPILLARALLPLMPKSDPAMFASISARVGSIEDNRMGGWYAYRASKAAQNQLLKTLAIELHRSHPHACCLLLHPGTVDTPLSGPFQARVPEGKLFSVERAADQLLKVMAACDASDSGRFIAWDGAPVPW